MKPRAAQVSVNPSGLVVVTGTDVQAAIAELDAAIAASSGYTDEQARDAIGAALVAGSNITITVDDAGNTITIAGTGGGGGGPGSPGFIGYASGGSSITPPARIDKGDLVLYMTRGTSSVTPPSGWTEVEDGTASSGNLYSFGYRVLSNADLPGPWSFTGASAVNVAVYRGVGTPTFSASTKHTAVDATSVTMGSVSGLSTSDRLVRLLGTATNGTAIPSFTTNAAGRGAAQNGIFWATGIADAIEESGSVGSVAASWSNNADWVYVNVTLPAA